MRVLQKHIAFAACALPVLFTLIFLAALGASFIPAFRISALLPDIDRARIMRTAFFTVKQAFFSTLIACVIGLPAAFFLARRQFAGQKLLSSLAAIPFAVPALLAATGFVSVFGLNGMVNSLLPQNMKISILYSFYGIITVQGVYNFPLVMKNCADAWQKLRPDEKNAALMLGAGPARVFRTVTLFQLLPSVLSSCVMVFLFCYFSFTIILLFGAAGTSTLEVELYHNVRSLVNIRAASVTALVESCIALAVFALSPRLQKKAEKSRGHAFAPEKKKLSRAEIIPLAALAGIIGVFLLFPIASILLRGIIPRNLLSVITTKAFPGALYTSLAVSFCSAFLSVTAASAYCCLLARGRRQTILNPRCQSLFHIPLVPLAVSSTVLGLGIMLLVKQGNAVIYVIARSSLLWAFAFKMISPAFERVPPDVIRAAALLSPSWTDTVFGVLLPETQRARLSAFAFCFAACAADISLPLMLAIPRFDTLALYIYRLAGAYRLNQACAAGAVLLLICAGVFVLADKIDAPGKT